MHINITARHLKLTSPIADYVERKLEKAKRFIDPIIWTQVILGVEKTRHMAEIIIHASGHTFTSKGESTDLYAAIDLASDKIDQQLRRYKERHRERRPENRRRTPKSNYNADLPALIAPEGDPRVSSLRVLRLTPLSVEEAISSMEQSDSAHWIF